jgi:hypothetical protein
VDDSAEKQNWVCSTKASLLPFDIFVLSIGIGLPIQEQIPMATLHFNQADRARLAALVGRYSVTEYAVLKRLVYLGLERVDAGEELFGSKPVKPVEEVALRLENRLNLILKRLHEARIRDFNMTLELLEQTIWLRTLGDELKPGGQPKVDERLQKAAPRILRSLHLPPPEAKGIDS